MFGSILQKSVELLSANRRKDGRGRDLLKRYFLSLYNENWQGSKSKSIIEKKDDYKKRRA